VDGDTAGAYQFKLRGVTLDQFDGRNWASKRDTKTLARGTDGSFNLQRPETHSKGRLLHYHVAMEPLLSDVFFLLATPSKLQGNYRVVAQDAEEDVFNLDSEHPVTRYEADSVLRGAMGKGSRDLEAKYPTDIPEQYLHLQALDPRVQKLTEQITASLSSPLDKASAVENYLRMHYGYTLQLPDRTPKDPISNFLFERKQGHCEYFASAMAVMLRSIGIPSRLVNGFSGGEFNDLTSQYVIRESDAHSWVEAYIPGQGWMEFDPTPAAAAQPHTKWGRFLMYLDAMSSFWRDWIVNYDLGHQLRLTQDAGRGSRELVSHAQSWAVGKYEATLAWARKVQERVGSSAVKWVFRAFAVLLLVTFATSVPRLLAFLRKFRLARRPERAPHLAASIWYQRMLKILARRGWQKSPAQTPEEFASAIRDVQLKQRVTNFTEHYENARFGGSAEEASRLSEIYDEIKHAR
jgi:transglutaminase-like putative cysteine protease